MAWILRCEMCKFCLEICYNCGDIEFFSKGLFFIAHSIYFMWRKKVQFVLLILVKRMGESCMVSRGSLSYRSSDSHKPRWLHYDLGHQSRLMAQSLLSLEYCSGSLRSRSHHVNWTELEPWTCANWWERSHRTNSSRTMRPRSICSQSVRSRSMWRDAELCCAHEGSV